MSSLPNDNDWIGVAICYAYEYSYSEVGKLARSLALKYGTEVRVAKGKWFDQEGWEILAPTGSVREYESHEREQRFLASCEPDPDYDSESEREDQFGHFDDVEDE